MEVDKTYPHFLILVGWYWDTEEGGTNLQARFYSQSEQGSDIRCAQLQRQWKTRLQEQGICCSLALTVRCGAPWLLPSFSDRGWSLEGWLSGELYNLEQSTFVEWVPRVHRFPMPVCYSTVMGRLGQTSRSHVGIHCRMWRRGTEWLLSSIVYYENIFSNRNSCEPGFPGLIGVEECAPSAAFYWCCLHIYFGLAQI